jgi:hypothetical protein
MTATKYVTAVDLKEEGNSLLLSPNNSPLFPGLESFMLQTQLIPSIPNQSIMIDWRLEIDSLLFTNAVDESAQPELLPTTDKTIMVR